MERQIQNIVKRNWSAIWKFNNRNRADGSIGDICDGNIIRSNLEDLKYTLLMNVDGVQVFKKSQKSLWPVQFYANFLPPETRFYLSNIIVAGFYFGKKKPDLLDFLQPLGKELQKIEENGIFVEVEGEMLNIKVSITHCSLDLPARAMVQAMTQFNGYCSCPYCLHPGISVPNEKNNRTTIRYIWRGKPEKLRGHTTTLHNMLEALEKNVNNISIC